MLVIRLARGGRAKYPTYRIVAAESARAATGKFVEVLGHYNPHTKELVIKKEETQKRLSNGAQPSNSVVKLLQRENIELPEWVQLKTKTRNPKKEPVEKPVSEKSEATEVTTPEASPEQSEAAPAEEAVASVAASHSEDVAENKVDGNVTETAEDTKAQADASEKSSEVAAENAEEAAKK